MCLIRKNQPFDCVVDIYATFWKYENMITKVYELLRNVSTVYDEPSYLISLISNVIRDSQMF